MCSIFSLIDWILFIILALCAGYLLLFAIASLFYREKHYGDTDKRHRFLVLFPAYAEDAVIVHSIKTFLQQDYPKELYQIVTISDHQKETTVQELQSLPITTLVATYDNSSKAKALILAINSVKETYDTVVIMDADNLAPTNLLTELNKMRAAGKRAIQVHRKGITSESQVSILDGVSEEINNGIFRKGHQVLGLSSALTGSGMAFEYEWFRNNITKASSAGEDKELEAMLLKQRIPVAYSDRLYVLDKKTEKQEAISNQRKRWIASQFHLVFHSLPDLAKAIFTLNLSYADKILQWMLPPRLIQIGLIFGLTFIMLILGGSDVYTKWLILCAAQIAAMLLPMPSQFWSKKLFSALIHIPRLAITMFINLFHLKGASKNFSHTKHD
jgi:cellulose synthase/poly-beta-1,6-N-acetylglucosamine synthase-like glycosyltransferase